MRQTINLLIVDDEAPARNRLRMLLAEINPKLTLFEAKNGIEALEMAQTHVINIVLLDIRMPGMNGLEAAQHLNQLATPPAIIFSTAYEAHALQAFDCNAVDYLLKPIRSERLKIALEKAQPLLPKQLDALQPLMAAQQHISINERGRILLIPIQDIVYFRAELKYITVRTLSREYLLEESLTHLEALFSTHFIRCHRNCIVAKNYVAGFERKMIEQNFADEESQNMNEKSQEKNKEKHWVVLLKGINEVIPISRRHQHIIQEFTVS